MAYLCYFPHSDSREYLPLEHLRRKMRSTKRTVIRRKLPPQKVQEGEPFNVRHGLHAVRPFIRCHNRVLGYLYAMGPEKVSQTSQIDEPAPRSTRWSWEAELQRCPTRRRSRNGAGAARDAHAERRIELGDARGPGCPRSDGAHRPGLHGGRAAAVAWSSGRGGCPQTWMRT